LINETFVSISEEDRCNIRWESTF